MTDNASYLYFHKREDTQEIFYVGIGVGKSYKRAYDKSNRNKFWHNTTNKVPYTVKIVYTGLSWEKARSREIKLIKLLGRRDLKTGALVNLTEGGDGSYKRIVTQTTRDKIRTYQIAHPKDINSSSMKNLMRKISPEHRLKLINGRKAKGWNNHKHKSVICTKTGIIYSSVKEAAPYSGWSKSHLASMLRGDKPNTTTLQYK